MHSFSEIQEQARMSNCGYWQLRSKRDRYSPNFSVVGDNISQENVVAETGMEELKKYVDLHTKSNENIVFEVYLMPKSTSNGSKRLGPFEFQLDPKRDNIQQQQQQLGNPYAGGSIPELRNEFLGALQMQQQMFEPRIALAREQSLLDYEKKDLAKERENFEKEKIEVLKKLEDLKKQYESKSEIAKNGLEKAVWNIVSVLTKESGSSTSQLSGTTAKVIEAPQEPLTQREKNIESIAQNINENVPELDDITDIGILVQRHIELIHKRANELPKSKSTNTNETGDNNTGIGE